MDIIKQVYIEKEGDDGIIHKYIAIICCEDDYIVIEIVKKPGWFGENIHTNHTYNCKSLEEGIIIFEKIIREDREYGSLIKDNAEKKLHHLEIINQAHIKREIERDGYDWVLNNYVAIICGDDNYIVMDIEKFLGRYGTDIKPNITPNYKSLEEVSKLLKKIIREVLNFYETQNRK